ncbi:hypothetical protein [Streptomyces sp. NPDC046985]|uniref:hypothetical protein n=1 Tax=Streptomyces sp. NPDC046985 TaxID=3155377 RepID=UPI0033F00D1F
MKKRSMLALASLATGFVVAAVSPSHAVDHDTLGDLHVKDTVGTMDRLVGHDGLAVDDDALGQGA